MTVAAVAELSLGEVAAQYNSVLKCDDGAGEFVNFTDLPSAAVWADHMKCKGVTQPYCSGFASAMDADLFGFFHLGLQAYDPEGLASQGKLPVKAQAIDEQFKLQDSYWQPNAITMLRDIHSSWIDKPRSPWSWSFMLRFAVHSWGDLHQPLHTGDLYGVNYPTGDTGGNLIRMNNTGRTTTWSNLHALWDAGGGAFGHDFGQVTSATARARAQELIQEFPASTFVADGRLSKDWNNANAGWGLANTTSGVLEGLKVMVNDTFQFVPGAYKEYLAGGLASPDRPFRPSDDYIANAQALSKSQIALGGYRLASWLNAHAAYLPPQAEGCSRPSPNLVLAARVAQPVTSSEGDVLARTLFALGGAFAGVAGATIALAFFSRKSASSSRSLSQSAAGAELVAAGFKV